MGTWEFSVPFAKGINIATFIPEPADFGNGILRNETIKMKKSSLLNCDKLGTQSGEKAASMPGDSIK